MRTHRIRRSVWIAALGTLLAASASAALRKLDVDGLTARSRYIVCGEVVELRSYWGEFLGAGRVMLTDVRIRVTDVWKDGRGTPPGLVRAEGAPASGLDGVGPIREVTLHSLGGRIGDEWQVCPESPRYEKGEKVLAFVRELNGKLWTTGWLQGKYSLVERGTAAAPLTLVDGKPDLPVTAPVDLAELKNRIRSAVERHEKEAER